MTEQLGLGLCAPDLRCGRWQDALADVGEVGAIITDPPYGERTHGGQRHGRVKHDDPWNCSVRGLAYAHWTPADVAEFVFSWSPRCKGWLCAMTSHDLLPAWYEALEAAGRYVFAPLACVTIGMNIRLAGDGPSNWTIWLVVSRPRTLRAWGTLPGAYVNGQASGIERAERRFAGGKSVALMLSIVADYTRPGDLVCDPCAGGATTALACHSLGRRFVGAEMDPETHAKALARLEAHCRQPALFPPGTGERKPRDGVLL